MKAASTLILRKQLKKENNHGDNLCNRKEKNCRS